MKLAITAFGLLLALSSGCGGDGGSGGGGFLPAAPIVGTPVVEETFPAEVGVPRAAAASGAVDLATQATANVILDDYTEGEATGAPHLFLSYEFEFTRHVEFEIDLDSEGRNGDDRFPNITGLLAVTVDAVLAGSFGAGEGSHSVLVEAATDIEAVDPDSGIETLIPQGSSWAFALAVTWEVTDWQNWVVVATCTKAVEVEGLIVTDGDAVTSVSIVGARQISIGIAKIDGEIVKEREIEGSFTVTLDDGAAVVEVLIEFDADGLIVVTIGDDVFGPFTPAEFREFFGVQFA